MGRRKVAIRRIEDKATRQVTFCKRRTGLIKKARELSVLCDVEVGLLVVSGDRKFYEFSSGNSLEEIIKQYQNHHIESKGCKSGDETTLQSASCPGLTYPEMLHLVQGLPAGPECRNPGDAVIVEKELLITQEAQQLQAQMGNVDNVPPQEPPFIYFDPTDQEWRMY